MREMVIPRRPRVRGVAAVARPGPNVRGWPDTPSDLACDRGSENAHSDLGPPLCGQRGATSWNCARVSVSVEGHGS